jgi:hypothetical protein
MGVAAAVMWMPRQVTDPYHLALKTLELEKYFTKLSG